MHWTKHPVWTVTGDRYQVIKLGIKPAIKLKLIPESKATEPCWTILKIAPIKD